MAAALVVLQADSASRVNLGRDIIFNFRLIEYLPKAILIKLSFLT